MLKRDLKSPEEAEEAVGDADIAFHYAANLDVRLSTTNPEIHFNENVVTTLVSRRLDHTLSAPKCYYNLALETRLLS